jgi:hypothetical protein
MRFALKLYYKMTKRFFALLQFKTRNPHRNSEIELVDRSYCYQYMQKIFLTYSVEGQVSRSDERYLLTSSRLSRIYFRVLFLISDEIDLTMDAMNIYVTVKNIKTVYQLYYDMNQNDLY